MTEERRRADAAPDRFLGTLERLLAIRATDVRGALDEAGSLIREAIEGDKVDIFLHDPSIDSLVAMGVSDSPMGRRQIAIGLDRIPLANGGLAVEVYRTGAPHNCGRNDEDPDQLRGVWEGLGALSSLNVPLEVGGERRGVLEADAARPDAFTEGDQRFLETVARWVGLVVQRAELTERVAREAVAQARRATAEELVGILAHDLRAPLQPLRGYLELLHRFARREERERDVGYAGQALEAAARLGGMIDNLLDAARLEQGLFALSLQPVDVSILARETAAVLSPPATPIEVRAPDDLMLQADPARLRQALENLLGNALAHSPDGAPVALRVDREAREDGEWVVLTVRDAGPGIAPEVLPTLFDRFARGASSTGLGLGLYLSRSIAEAHGGALTVESEPGKGTSFRLALPSAPCAGAIDG